VFSFGNTPAIEEHHSRQEAPRNQERQEIQFMHHISKETTGDFIVLHRIAVQTTVIAALLFFGTLIATPATFAAEPATKLLTSFEGKNPFEGGAIVAEHATDGTKSLRLDKGLAAWSGPQNWAGFDYLKMDLYTDSDKPMPLSLEIRDKLTTGYWTRVNHESLIAPGSSTLVIPLAQLYVGEKARPGRNLQLDGITHWVIGIGGQPAAPLYIDNIRLERDTETKKAFFDGLHAFDFGPATGPVMPGFTRIDPSTTYSKERGYGLKNAQIWRAFDVLQPDPLYQDFICIQHGGLAVDLPNGKYHVFVNIDNPSGFWGEYQTYRQRKILAQGKVVVDESMTFDSLKKKYFRHWDTEDLPEDTLSINTSAPITRRRSSTST